MKASELTVKIIHEAIWPIVVVFAVIYLKKPIFFLLSKLNKIKYGGLEMEFNDLLEKAGKTADKTLDENRTRILAMAKEYPVSAVLEGFRKLEDNTRDLIALHQKDVVYPADTPYKQIQNILTKNKLIDTKNIKLFSELRIMRNKIAHASGHDISSEQAIRFLTLSFALEDQVQKKIEEKSKEK